MQRIYILEYISGIHNSLAIVEQPRQGRGVDWEWEQAGSQGTGSQGRGFPQAHLPEGFDGRKHTRRVQGSM